MKAGCPFCEGPGGRVVGEQPKFRLVHIEEPGLPAFYRLVWTQHVVEFSDLANGDRRECMDAVTHVEELLRKHLAPVKVNLAALGNMVPHLHWHIIARFPWDSHFPDAVWAAARREAPAGELARVQALLPALEQEIARALRAA
jgi:diadenosine tetraphosphate (Ap4A) HIT family hydrolase